MPKKSEKPNDFKAVKKQTSRTFKRLSHRVNNLSKNFYVATVSYVNGKFDFAGSPALCEALRKQDIIDAMETAVNEDIASKYLKSPVGLKKKEKLQSKSQSSLEEEKAAKNVEALMEDMTDD